MEELQSIVNLIASLITLFAVCLQLIKDKD